MVDDCLILRVPLTLSLVLSGSLVYEFEFFFKHLELLVIALRLGIHVRLAVVVIVSLASGCAIPADSEVFRHSHSVVSHRC